MEGAVEAVILSI